jgi:hypothetical protein
MKENQFCNMRQIFGEGLFDLISISVLKDLNWAQRYQNPLAQEMYQALCDSHVHPDEMDRFAEQIAYNVAAYMTGLRTLSKISGSTDLAADYQAELISQISTALLKEFNEDLLAVHQ